MKFFKPFTPPYDKKEMWGDYWYNTMKELAEINGETVDLKEKYGRMDATFGGYSEILEETMNDYEKMSEDSCMYCNKLCKQYWTHEDSRLIHLCLPCLILDKITILLEKIITWWRKPKTANEKMAMLLILEILVVWLRLYIEIYILSVS